MVGKPQKVNDIQGSHIEQQIEQQTTPHHKTPSLWRGRSVDSGQRKRRSILEFFRDFFKLFVPKCFNRASPREDLRENQIRIAEPPRGTQPTSENTLSRRQLSEAENECNRAQLALEDILSRKVKATLSIAEGRVNKFLLLLNTHVKPDSKPQPDANQLRAFEEEIRNFNEDLKSYTQMFSVEINEEDIRKQVPIIFERMKTFHQSLVKFLKSLPRGKGRKEFVEHATLFAQIMNEQQRIYHPTSSDPYLQTLTERRDESLRKAEELKSGMKPLSHESI
jgi:hypothetical protein